MPAAKKSTQSAKASEPAKAGAGSGPNPGVIVTPFPPVSQAQALAAQAAARPALARDAVANLVTMNS